MQICSNTSYHNQFDTLCCHVLYDRILKDFKHNKTSVLVAKRFKAPVVKRGVAGSIPGGDIIQHAHEKTSLMAFACILITFARNTTLRYNVNGIHLLEYCIIQEIKDEKFYCVIIPIGKLNLSHSREETRR